MDEVIRFTKRYGYVAAEELIFRVVALAFWPNWYGVIFISAIAFGLCHCRFGWLAAFGSLAAGMGLGYLYVFVIPYPLNIIAVVGIHLVWALFGDKYI